jgi:energy-coupling factor transport system permease protein
MRVGTLYVARESPLHRLHPLTKIVVLTMGLVVAFSAHAPGGGELALAPWILLVVLLAVAAVGQVLRPLLTTMARIVLPLMISLFIIHGLLYHEPGTVLMQFGAVTIKREGLLAAADICTRLIAFVSAFLLLLQTTHPGSLAQALVAKGAPPWLGHVLLSAFQMLPEAVAQANVIMDAQRARGLAVGGRSLLGRLRSVPPLLAPLLLSLLADVEDQAMALEARGFSRRGARTSLNALRERSWEPALRWASVLAGLAAVAWMRGWVS